MLSALFTLAALITAQDPTPAPPIVTPPLQKPGEPSLPAKATDESLDTLIPGQLPADASEAARNTWLALCKATSGEKPQPKVTSFDLRFDGRLRVPGEEGLHDLSDARYRYTEPGWLGENLSKGIERLRGPRGDWFLKDEAWTKLQGADFENDTRELNERIQVARTFVGLIDPRALRMRSLAVLATPPFALPPAQLESAKKLIWLDVVSPDFERPGADKNAQPRTLRAQIGVDPKTHLPQLALVAQDDNGTLVHETALLVKLDNWRALDGFQVPGVLTTYPPELSRSPWTFSDAYNLKLGLRDGTLRPKLVEQDFLPRDKR